VPDTSSNEQHGFDGSDTALASPPFLTSFLLLDLEAVNDRIYAIGAVLGEKVFQAQGKFVVDEALTALDRFAQEARGVLGHNLLDHDLALLNRLRPGLAILRKPVVDTLVLSPLAFPENPYHRLVKDYKLVKDSLNDPVADAQLAASVFVDQWRSFTAMAAGERTDLLSFYRFCFDPQDGAEGASTRGIASVFAALGAPPVSIDQARDLVEEMVHHLVCRSACRDHLLPAFEDVAVRPALSYIVAWLRVAGSNSVLPPWVLRRFPEVKRLLKLLRTIPCEDDRCAYCRENFDSSSLLQRYFGFSAFRPLPASEDGESLQETIVSAGMQDRPLLAILPTGGGKSLCYQLPALARYYRLGLLTIVVSPLQALMKDQVDHLAESTGTPCAAAINGLLTPPERGEVLERVRLGDVAILYVAPEQLRNRSFREAIGSREIGAWVIDEAHCISKWGHDFRPDYLYTARFIREFAEEQKGPRAPVAGFTATAKSEVKSEIVEYFKRELGQELRLFEAGVERENLHFEVRAINRPEKYSAIHEILADRLSSHASGSAVVYAATRAGTETIARYLKEQGWHCEAFHAGLNAAEKRDIQERFLAGSLQVIAATNAFGMGIDKKDVRLVLHADISGSLESYLQEAGRAGRDLKNAHCVLLYDENDIETQFNLGSASQLSRKDIAQILRGLRRASRNRGEEIVITTGELLRDEELETSFDLGDRQADTKVKTAIAWLERSAFLQRNENHTRVFQGKLLVRSLGEAANRISQLNLAPSQQGYWLAILSAMINAESDDMLNADRLAELAGIPEVRESRAKPEQKLETASQRVIRILHQMAEAGLLDKGVMLTAFVRHKVKNPSRQILKQLDDLEEDMLKLLRQEAPDAEELGWSTLSLRVLNQRLRDLGHVVNPDVPARLLKSLSLDGRGFAGSHGSLQCRHLYQDHYRVKLLRSWDAVIETSKKRRGIARALLDAILSPLGPEQPPSAELLLSFSTNDLANTLKAHIFLSRIKDPLAAIDRGLMFLHEQKVIILQQGLAVFRQAMSIRMLPQARKRRYLTADFEPLAQHYRERTFQIHVMNEYARLGLRAISRALELVLAYFTLEKAAFIRRYFPGRKELLERATGEASYQHIVEDLANPAQIHIVTAGDEANMLVLAGPGSGKTRVVIHRCAYLIRVLRVPPESVLIVCFNHFAALSLRRRLVALLGEDARGVTVQTYHGIAMRITGTSFAELSERSRGRREELPFSRLIPDAVKLLRGETEVPGLPADEWRDRLLSSFRHILVDEYQDIDESQYDLISALAGRTDQDPDRKLTILAVGDDDQNIYSWRGANIEFIQRFREDYHAEIHYLVENYRSTGHIIAAANGLIGHNRDRMKTSHPICRDHLRADEPPGGGWAELDPLVQGRVQVLTVTNLGAQAAALVDEWKRLQGLNPDLKWTDVAVLARTRESLAPVRALCEVHQVPHTWGIDQERSPALHRLREIACFLDLLKTHRERCHRASELQDLLQETAGSQFKSPWWGLLRELLSAWELDTADAELPASQTVEWIYESLAERRREQRLGQGVLLSTVHGAKGMEYPHVFILDGDWKVKPSEKQREEERRLLYVAMTRAKETLCIFHRLHAPNPCLNFLQGEFLAWRRAEPRETPPPDLLKLRYELLGMKDMDLGFAGRKPSTDPIHRHLAALVPGVMLTPTAEGSSIALYDPSGNPVAKLSKSALQTWLPRLSRIRQVRVIGMIRRMEKDEAEAFRPQCRCEQWEVPWVEFTCLPGES
jgi:ATP-dependent DNA helicase RecQ